MHFFLRCGLTYSNFTAWNEFITDGCFTAQAKNSCWWKSLHSSYVVWDSFKITYFSSMWESQSGIPSQTDDLLMHDPDIPHSTCPGRQAVAKLVVHMLLFSQVSLKIFTSGAMFSSSQQDWTIIFCRSCSWRDMRTWKMSI